MILGFTGTRHGLTAAQRAVLPSVVACLPERVLHGGAVGADEDFHDWLADITDNGRKTSLIVEVYPTSLRAAFWRVRRYGPFAPEVAIGTLNPLDRNRIIAANCDHLLACPAAPDEQLRSGTWATVRYARAAGKPVTLLLPDGSVREERR